MDKINRLLGLLLAIASLSGLLYMLSMSEEISIDEPGQSNSPANQISRVSDIMSETVSGANAEIMPGINLAFRFNDEATAVYRFNYESQGKIDFNFLIAMASDKSVTTKAVMTDIKLVSNGLLLLKFFQQSPQHWHVAAQVTALDYKINGQDNRYTGEISRPFSFAINSRGKLANFSFTKGITDESRQFIQQFMANLQLSLPQEKASAWETEETDITGRFLASYQIRSQKSNPGIWLMKENLRYLDNRIAQSAIGIKVKKTLVNVDNSQAIYRFSPGDAWINSAEKHESISIRTGNTLWSHMSGHLTIKKIAQEVPVEFDISLAAHRQKLDTEAVLRARYTETLPDLDAMAEGLDLGGVIDKYLALKDNQSQQSVTLAKDFLVNYLRKKPQASQQLIDMMDADMSLGFDDETHLFLWYAVTQAGHPDAQQAMLAAVTNNSYNEVTRLRALSYLHDFEYPQPLLVAAFENQTDDRVKQQALNVFAELESSAAQIDWTKAKILETDNSNERLAYVHVLGRSLATNQDNRAILNQLVKKQGVSTAVRRAAYNYILAK